MLIASCVYVAAICAANISVFVFGPAVTIINAFLFIGLDMGLRDLLHVQLGMWRMIGLSVLAGVISYAVNPAAGVIAVASVAAFIAAAVVDAFVFQAMHRRSWMQRANGSNLFAAAADSLTFPTIAFGGFIPAIVLGQFVAKVAGGFIWSLVLKAYRR